MSTKDYVEKIGDQVVRGNMVKATYMLVANQYGAKIEEKAESILMKGAGYALKLMGVMDVNDFLKRFTTTIKNVIYVPFKVGVNEDYALVRQLGVLVHEIEHVKQYYDEKEMFMLKYLADSGERAYYEGMAQGAAMEFHIRSGHWGSGDRLDKNIEDYIEYSKDKLVKYYLCDKEDVEATDGILRSTAVMVKDMIRSNEYVYEQVGMVIKLLGLDK